MALLIGLAMGAAQAVELPDNIGGGEYYASKDGSMIWDKNTGLVWARCSQGQSWNGKTCTGEAKEFEWEQALEEAKSFNAQGGLGGYTDWQVPKLAQLAGLRVCSTGFSAEQAEGLGEECALPKAGEANRVVPTIDTVAFPKTDLTGHWSSSPYVGSSNSAWGVLFANGSVYNGYRNVSNHVRLVRASQLSGGEAVLVFTEKLPSVRDTLLAKVEAEIAAEKEYKLDIERSAERESTWLYKFADEYRDLQQALLWFVLGFAALSLPWIVFRKKLVIHLLLPVSWWSRGLQVLVVWTAAVFLGGVGMYTVSGIDSTPTYYYALQVSFVGVGFAVVSVGLPLLLLAWLVRFIIFRVQRKRAGNT